MSIIVLVKRCGDVCGEDMVMLQVVPYIHDFKKGRV